MSTSERKIQWEFKVIVRVDESVWPHELRDAIEHNLDDDRVEVASVELIRDYT